MKMDIKRRFELTDYVIKLATTAKNTPCHVCKHVKGKHICYDPDLVTIGYLCEKCFLRYTRQIEKEKEKALGGI